MRECGMKSTHKGRTEEETKAERINRSSGLEKMIRQAEYTQVLN